MSSNILERLGFERIQMNEIVLYHRDGGLNYIVSNFINRLNEEDLEFRKEHSDYSTKYYEEILKIKELDMSDKEKIAMLVENEEIYQVYFGNSFDGSLLDPNVENFEMIVNCCNLNYRETHLHRWFENKSINPYIVWMLTSTEEESLQMISNYCNRSERINNP